MPGVFVRPQEVEMLAQEHGQQTSRGQRRGTGAQVIGLGPDRRAARAFAALLVVGLYAVNAQAANTPRRNSKGGIAITYEVAARH